MTSPRLARQAYTKQRKRARREVEKVTAAVRAEICAEQEARDAARAEQAVLEAVRQHQEQLQLAEEIKEGSEESEEEEGASVVATIERIMEAHMSRLMRRIDALEATVEALQNSITHSPQPPQLQEDLLLAPCKTLDELEELDRSLVQQDRRNKMQHFLGTIGGATAGDAIRRILRRVATNDVLSLYSLKGRRAKKSFQELSLCKIITAACVKNFPGQTEAEVEDRIGQALKFAPHKRSTGQPD